MDFHIKKGNINYWYFKGGEFWIFFGNKRIIIKAKVELDRDKLDMALKSNQPDITISTTLYDIRGL
jgi:hypothetical protein